MIQQVAGLIVKSQIGLGILLLAVAGASCVRPTDTSVTVVFWSMGNEGETCRNSFRLSKKRIPESK